jgi:hypothetical protein
MAVKEPPVDFSGESSGSPPDLAGDIIDAGNRTPINAGTAKPTRAAADSTSLLMRAMKLPELAP